MGSISRKDISLRLLVEETLDSHEKDRFEPVEFDSLKTYQIAQVKPGFYTVKHGELILDFPMNWGAFKDVDENNVIEIAEYDQDLNEALSHFYNVAGEFKLVKSSDSIYFVFSPHIKKAAA